MAVRAVAGHGRLISDYAPLRDVHLRYCRSTVLLYCEDARAAPRGVDRPSLSRRTVTLDSAKSSPLPSPTQDLASASVFTFGPFRLYPAQQLLLKHDAPVHMGARAIELLAALAERSGQLVLKGELMARAWPHTVVEESNLKVHMTALRRALGDGQDGQRYIATVVGRGYRFVSPVVSGTSPMQSPMPAAPPSRLPALTTCVVGRDEAIAAIGHQLQHHRLVTVLGPGGIGKTTVALSVAQEVAARNEADVRFADLGVLADSRFVGHAIAAAIGLTLQGGDSLATVVRALALALRGHPTLLVLDSCELVIDDVAAHIERMLNAVPELRILATSRETLRVRGECVHRLHPLELPPPSPTLSADQALSYAAVDLFVRRAAECVDDFRLRDEDAPIVADICRRLDGIALAIELAATRVDAFGIRELQLLLDDRFRVLRQDRRGALPRHRTLGAALDWSYNALPADEQALLRSLSVFVAPFTLESAVALHGLHHGATALPAATCIIDRLARLVAKSLVVADLSLDVVHYRLLDTTRAYGQHKLLEHDELDLWLQHHAQLTMQRLASAEAEGEKRPTDEWLHDHHRKIDDVRSALRWAFAAEDAMTKDMAIALTLAAIPLWMHLSLYEECQQFVRRALLRVDAEADPVVAMKLTGALAAALLYATGSTPEAGAAWQQTLEFAERTGDAEHRLRALWGLSVYHTYRGEHRTALEIEARFRKLADETGDQSAQYGVDRMTATSLRYLGDQTRAQSHLERMLSAYVTPARRSHIARFQLDQRAAAYGTLSNVLWLRGYPDRAVTAARHAFTHAQMTEHALSISNALVHATCSIALHVGDYDGARHGLTLLREHLALHPIGYWNALSVALDGLLRIALDDRSGIALLRESLDELDICGFRLRFPAFLGALAQGLGAAGHLAEAHATIDAAITSAVSSGECWCLAELLRIKGELWRVDARHENAETCFLRSLSTARESQALSWELRAMTSYSQLLSEHGRNAEAASALAGVLGRFTEGYGTADLQQARTLIGSLRDHLRHDTIG
ncbi:hypothetical protein LMG32289_00355 [Cupriavidus pampae]|uniref:OmpR/PhoB-type domain-containing protein n=1 Tax=Cupriavidus pampae TaxID=659251 RepID=A0ABM8W9V0_9BURK|nr:hypothetical protein LMG32289_00355 [Cupriavidus pampae]